MALPFILSLLGSAAAGAGVLGSLSPLIAGSLGAGLGQAIQTGDIKEGIKTGLTSGILGGLGGALAQRAAGAGTAAATGAMGAQAGAGAGAAADAAKMMAAQAATQQAAQAPGMFGGMFQNMQPGFTAGTPMPGGVPLSKQMITGFNQGTMTGAGLGTALGGAMAMPPNMMPGTEKIERPQADPANRERYTPPAGFRPGLDPEFTYFNPNPIPSTYAEGGAVRTTRMPSGAQQYVREGTVLGPRELAYSSQRRMRTIEDAIRRNPEMEAELHEAFMDEVRRSRAARQTERQARDEDRARARGYARGGMVYTPTGTRAPVRMAAGGLADMGGMPGMAPEAPPNDKDIVRMAISAVRGEMSEQQAAMVLGQFLQTFGEEALRRLVDDVRQGRNPRGGDMEGQIRGPGDGMDDLVPAKMDDGSQDVLLSDGEFIVPADVVSGLGNGSSDAGAAELERMMSRVREARTGSTEQPAQVAVGGLLPA